MTLYTTTHAQADLVSEDQLGEIEALLRKVNQRAEVIVTTRSRLPPESLLGTARFNMQRAEEHPDWLTQARENEHTPETLEYGISSFVFRARRPFHPGRLAAALGSRPRPGPLGGLLRLKGFAWLATRSSQQANTALAGTQFTVTPGAPWWAAIPRYQWPNGLAEELLSDKDSWDTDFGDRRTELVCIGRQLDHAATEAALKLCTLTDDEMAGGERRCHPRGV